MLRMSIVLLLVACHQEGVDSGDPCPPGDSGLDWTATVEIPSGTAVQVEVNGVDWRVESDGECFALDDGTTYCPNWDFSDYHVVEDGYLVTLGGGIQGRVVNQTDRDWRVVFSH